MARHCEVCGKGMISGNKVSHSMRHSRRVWRPNIRTVRAIVNGSSKESMFVLDV